MTDLTLAAALLDTEQKARRLKHGRLTLVLEKFDQHCTDWRIHVDAMTEADMQRLMEERPRGWRR